MAELIFSIEATMGGKDREGIITVGGQELRYSAPASMDGKGVGASPETLLLGAVTACYSLTLLAYLEKRRLVFENLSFRTEGIVDGFPRKLSYKGIRVSPSIHGGKPERHAEYADAAARALARCFIGQTVAAGGVTYELGVVTVD